MFSTNMTAEEWATAAEMQRRHDLFEARQWRDHYQAVVEKLEAADPLRRVSTGQQQGQE